MTVTVQDAENDLRAAAIKTLAELEDLYAGTSFDHPHFPRLEVIIESLGSALWALDHLRLVKQIRDRADK